MRALLDVESEIASAEEKGLEADRAEDWRKAYCSWRKDSGRLPEEVCGQTSAERLRQWMSKVFTATARDELFAD